MSYDAAYYKKNATKIIARQVAYRKSRKGKASLKAWRKLNREKLIDQDRRPARKEQRRLADRLRRTGITQQQFDQAWREQGGNCAICAVSIQWHKRGSTFCASDHDHKTGKFRGLLCARCNAGLGQFLDRPDLLLLAAKYLERSQ